MLFAASCSPFRKSNASARTISPARRGKASSCIGYPLTDPPRPVRVERSRDTPLRGARPMGISTSLDANGSWFCRMRCEGSCVVDDQAVDFVRDVLETVGHAFEMAEKFARDQKRSEEHTSELKSLMRISYA